MKKGFTLTELLAVVVIIAILAGIGMGSYKSAVERSKLQEGIVMGHAVMQAVGRYYMDHTEKSGTARTQPDISLLDLSLSNGSVSGKSFTGKNFSVSINSNGSVTVQRVGENVKILITQQGFGSSRNTPDSCVNDVDLCKGMGFISCSGSTCSKPE